MLFWERQKTVWSLYEKYTQSTREQFQLTRIQFDILMFLHNNPQFDTAADMVKVRRLTKSQVSVALKDLEDRGFVRSDYADGNKKSRHLCILPAASDIISAGKQAQIEFGQLLFRGFTASEKQSFQKMFQRIYENAAQELEEF